LDFRTEIEPKRADTLIGYSTPLVFLGSCFAAEIGAYLKEGKFDTLINPFGVLYNPVSLAKALRLLIEKRLFTEEDLHKYNKRYLSFYHDSSFSSSDAGETLRRINTGLDSASIALRKAKFLFITFGTARVYRFLKSNKVVSNCHKIPSVEFQRELLSSESISEEWGRLIGDLKAINPGLKVVFTVSPVRHWKDGPYGNQLSKSVLFVAIEELMKKNETLSYFPSYELMIDDLRDYRFYKKDMLHPSPQAVEYIWDFFRRTWFSESGNVQYKEITRITEAVNHRIIADNPEELKAFRESMLQKVEKLQNKYAFPDLSAEKMYFENL